jgi:Xaa-Pro aminopeptidase
MEEAATAMDAIVASWHFSKPSCEKAARDFVKSYRESAKRGSLGHQVGMSTHDVGQGDTLQPGMVFTIEPQFRVPAERLYFRLEDLIVIGEEKAEIVSGWLAADIDAVEKVVQEPGILQRYPRDPEGLPER